ncbi:MAG: amidase, partial [Abiotrophia defectiva]|nr:amidase [Abiotrophia defectiva]
MPLFKQDATYYAQEVKAGRLTASQLVDWALENIHALNPTLKAVAHVQAESARAQAQAHDQLWRQLSESERQELPAFFGVPILLKDLGQLQAGEPSYAGAQLMADYVANQTSYFVERIQALGFIVVGRTNVPEFGFKNISDAQFTGAVSYPGDLTRNAGGSSGGAAAALKAGMVPIVTASDGGGSIRIPASFCGLIGLKPSRGRVPVGPDGYRGWQGASVHFALTKSVRDTWTLLEGLQVEQWAAPYMVPRLSPGPLTLPQRPLRIAYLLDSPLTPQVRLDVANLLRQTVERLAGMGHELVPVDFPVDVIAAARDYTTMNAVETVAMMRGFEASLGRALTPDDMEPMTGAST